MGVETAEVVGVGAVPAVDGLVWVTYHAQVVAATQPGVEQCELQWVDILELIDVEVPEAPPLGVAEPLVGLEGPSALVQQVVEVDLVPLLLLGLVFVEDSGHHREGERWVPAGFLGSGGVGLGDEASGLGPLDLTDDIEYVGAAPVAGEQRCDQAELAVEQFGFGHVVVTPPGAQLGVGDRVECAGGHLIAKTQDTQPGPELCGSLAGEGEGQDAPGVAEAGEGTPGDTTGQHPRLSRACTGVDCEGNGVGRDSVCLRLVEAVQQGVGCS